MRTSSALAGLLAMGSVTVAAFKPGVTPLPGQKKQCKGCTGW